MNAQVTSVFLYCEDVRKSVDFYTEIVGAELSQLLSEVEDGPVTLAILKIGGFSLMLHPQDEHSEEFEGNRLGVGIHLQIRVDDVDAFYQHCLDEGAMLSVSDEPVDQAWGWREFALRDRDGYVWSIYQDKSDGQWT